MKPTLIAFWAVPAMVLTAPSAGAVTYYVSDCQAGAVAGCVAGSDSNNGISPSTPWQTIDKAMAQFNTMPAGSQILLAQGASFIAGDFGRLANFNCQAANPCVIGDYVASWGAGPKPLMTSTSGSNGFDFENGGATQPDGGYVVRNIYMKGSAPSGGDGIVLNNDTDDVTIDNVVVDSYITGVRVENYNHVVSRNFTLKNSQIINNPNMGFLGIVSSGTILNNDFINNGSAKAILNHNIYLEGSNYGNDGSIGSNMTVRGNRLYQSAMVYDSSVGAPICQGADMVMHGIWTGVVIEDNDIHEDVGRAGGGCWGIGVDPGYGSAEDMTGTVIRGNHITNVGNVGISIFACPSCKVEDNVIVQEQASFGTIGIDAGGWTPNNANDAQNTNETVRNNSIYIKGIPGAGNGSTGISVVNLGTGNTVVSNAIEFTGTGNFSCFNLNLPASDYAAVDNNLCHSANPAAWEGSTGDSLAAWRSAMGFDLSSTTSDPKFASLSFPYNLALTAGSAAIDAGHPTLSAPLDSLGNGRTGAPDMGAFEFNGVVDTMPPAPPRRLTVR